METPVLPQKQITGRHVLFMLVMFFLVVLAANVAMVWAARSSFNGLTEQDAYEKGVAWNETLAREKALKDAGWKAEITAGPGEKEIRIALSDKHGPADKVQGEVRFYRPVESGDDLSVPLEKTKIPGVYRAPARLPFPGLWEVRVHAVFHGQAFDTSQRMSFPE